MTESELVAPVTPDGKEKERKQLGDTWEKVVALQKMLGGKTGHLPGGKTWYWRARSTAAVDLAELMQPLAPSRAAAIEAFLWP